MASLLVRWLSVSGLGIFLLFAAPAQGEGLAYRFGAEHPLAKIMQDKSGARVYEEDRAPTYVLTRFVIEGATIDDWTEALEILNMRRPKGSSIAQWYEAFRANGQAHCASTWTVLAQDSDSITFERISPDCPMFSAQTALYRVLYGKRQMFMMIATRKGAMLADKRASWLELLATAKVE